MTPDMINGLFEMFGGVAIANHCRLIYRQRCVHGVSKLSVVFFLSWGLYNLWFYPHLDLPWSFAGGVVLCTMNFVWLGMLWWFWGDKRVRKGKPV